MLMLFLFCVVAQGRTDICVLNFFVFLCWDYVPTVLLLLMVVKERGKDTPATAVAKVRKDSDSTCGCREAASRTICPCLRGCRIFGDTVCLRCQMETFHLVL